MLVKVQGTVFAKGAQRQCFRAKWIPVTPGEPSYFELRELPISSIPGIGESTARRLAATVTGQWKYTTQLSPASS